MKKVEILKTVGKAIVAVGVDTIVINLARCTTPMGTRKLIKLCITVGALAIGGLVGDKAVEYTEKTIDEAITGVKEMVEKGELS